MKPLFKNFRRRHPQIRLIMECGRFIAATAGQFVIKVNNVKISHGREFVVTDGGVNCHMSAVGLGSVVRRNFPMKNLCARPGLERRPYHVTGPLCNPDDLLARNVELPETRPGDYLSVLKSGAYGPTASPVYFHSHGYPAEVVVWKGQAHLVRRRDTVDDLLDRQFLIPEEFLQQGDHHDDEERSYDKGLPGLAGFTASANHN